MSNNRIPPTKKISVAPESPITPKSLAHTFAAQVANAKDTDIVQVMVTTKRQATTTDCFRLTPPNGPDEICEGWVGLAHFFNSTDAADSICYLTAMKQALYPEDETKWTTVAKNFKVLRMAGKGGVTVTPAPTDLLPPLPGHALELPDIQRGRIERLPTPRELEAILMGK